jgi:hypothetical protein
MVEGRGGENRVLLAHAAEPIVSVTVEGRFGKEWCSFRTRTGANIMNDGVLFCIPTVPVKIGYVGCKNEIY